MLAALPRVRRVARSLKEAKRQSAKRAASTGCQIDMEAPQPPKSNAYAGKGKGEAKLRAAAAVPLPGERKVEAEPGKEHDGQEKKEVRVDVGGCRVVARAARFSVRACVQKAVAWGCTHAWRRGVRRRPRLSDSRCCRGFFCCKLQLAAWNAPGGARGRATGVDQRGQ